MHLITLTLNTDDNDEPTEINITDELQCYHKRNNSSHTKDTGRGEIIFMAVHGHRKPSQIMPEAAISLAEHYEMDDYEIQPTMANLK